MKTTGNSSIKALCIFTLVISFLGCGGSSDTGPAIESMILNNPESLFLAQSETGNSKSNTVKSIGDYHLFEILNNGTVQEALFRDENGNEVHVKPSHLIQLNDKYIGIEFNSGAPSYQNYRVAVDITGDGTLIDLSDFDLTEAIMTDNYLYVLQNQTIFRIDFDSLSATPMNNPSHNPIYHTSDIWYMNTRNPHRFFVANDYTVIANRYTAVGSGDVYLLYHDNSPPMIIEYFPKTFDGYAYGGTLAAENGYIYRFEWNYCEDPGYAKSLYHKYTFNKNGVSIETTELNSDLGRNFWFGLTYDLYDRERYFIFDNGYHHVTSAPDGGISVDYTSKSIPLPPGSTDWGSTVSGNMKLSGSVIYSQKEDTFYRMDIVNDTGFSELASYPHIIDWSVAGNTIIFHAYITGTDIGTYSIDRRGTIKLINNSKMNVIDICEFKF